MSKRLTEPMIEALYVALVQGSVWVGARWESANVGHVKSPSLTALIDRGMVMRNPRGEWELSRKGVRALADIEMITTDSYLNWVLGMRAVIENAHAEAAEMDERRTIARAFLSTPALIKNAPAEAMDYARTVADAFNANRAPSLAEQYAGTPARFNPEVIDSVHEQALKIDAKLSPEFLAQQAENERAYAAIKDREEAERVDTLIEQLDGAPAEPERPRKLDTWLQQGMILVSPLDGERYRFERWTGGTAVLVNQNNGALIRVSQHDVTAWSYLPQASAEGIAAAKAAREPKPWHPTYFRHDPTGQVYAFLGHDNLVTGALYMSHACSTPCSAALVEVQIAKLRSEWTAVCAHNIAAYATCRECGSGVELDDEGRVPDTREGWRAYAEKLKASRAATEEYVTALQDKLQEALTAQPQIVLEAALLRRVAAAEDARDEAQTQVSAVLHNIEQVAAYWARQSEREGFVPRAPWVALRCIVKEHTR